MFVRTMIIAAALAIPGVAAAEQTQTQSPMGLEVRGDDGTLMSRVERVERDSSGRVVAIEAPGLAPADAPAARSDLVAQNDDAVRFFTSFNSAERNDRDQQSAGGRAIRAR